MDYKLINFCEFDKICSKSYCAIHGVDESANLGDITKVDEKKLPYFNFICGGSPCQDFLPKWEAGHGSSGGAEIAGMR